jgi:hypothetical protein
VPGPNYRFVESERRAFPKATKPLNRVLEAAKANKTPVTNRPIGILVAKIARKSAVEIWNAGTPNVRIFQDLLST